MTAGDTVRVQPGSYPETVTPAIAGTAANPITYLADGLAVVDGGNTRCKAFDVVGTGYLVIDGFEITDQPDCGGADSAVDINNANNVTIRNNIIHDTGRDAIYFTGTSANGLVENNLIYNIDDDGSTPIGGGNHVFRNNTFAGTITGWALENGLGSNLFENNIFWVTAGNGAIQNTGLGTFNYNDYNAAVLPGIGNISSNPLFVGGYHLSHIAAGQGSNSPAIDAGSDTAANLGLDTRTTRTDNITDTATIDLGYHYDPAAVPPLVSGLAPSSGPKTGGTSVVISGSGFTGATAVNFGATPATGYAVDSDTQITATAPAGTLGATVDVQVTTPLGMSANTAADDYTYTGITYYVRTDGSDANTGLSNSPAGAWLTIQKAASTMTAGDTVRVQPGSYPETVTPAIAGTAANPITYLADGLAVVDGGNTRCKAFDVVGTGYLVIDGFEITDQPDCGGADSAVDINNANNVTIRNNIIHDTGRDAIYFTGTSANGLVENNLIYNIDDDGSTPIGGGNHVFRNNTFAGTITGWALENGLGSNLFENNIFWVTAGNGAIQNTGLGTFNYNDYNAAVLPGIGNISSNPLFVGGYHLSHIAAGQGFNSPAIDAGSDTAANLGLDTRTTRTDNITDTATIDLGYHYDPAAVPPLVSGLAPSSGPKTGGTSVVISGSGFTGATAVNFGATPATGYAVDSDTQITATAPAGTLGATVDVQVTTPLGISANTAADDYTYTGITYYVRTDGSDANTGLSNSPAGAWLTIQKAASTMTAGDTVRVQPGSYPETVTPAIAGTAANPITYLADGLAVVDGGNTRCKAFDVVGTGYLVIDGFEITDQPDCGGADSAVDINNANNVTIRNNIIHDTGRDAIYFTGTSANGLVENNLIYNIDDDGSTPIGGGNHVFRNNTFAGTITGWALENGLGSNLFENNIFWVTAGNGAIQNTGLGTFNYNDYNAAVLPGTGNISSNPLFVGGYHLSHIAAGQGSNSPAIDAGSDTAANLGLDTRTTRTDNITDTATIDLGYHYVP